MTWMGGCLNQSLLLKWGDDMDIQGCWAAMAPSRKEDVCWSGARARHQAGSLFDGSQSCRLGGTEENIPDRIVADNSVSISPTSNLVTEHVSDSSAKYTCTSAVLPFSADQTISAQPSLLEWVTSEAFRS